MTQTIDVQQIPVPDFIRSPAPKGMLIGGEWTQAPAAGFAMLTGQVCVAGTRILVHESVLGDFAAELATAVSAFRVGDPFDEQTMLGRDRHGSFSTKGYEAVPTNTRAAICWEVGRPWEITDCTLADPRAGEVLVKLEYAGLCHSDDHNITGDFPAALPVVGGHEGAGIVVAAGEGVDRVAAGDSVMLLPLPTCGKCRYCTDGRTYICDANLDVLTGARADGSFAFTTRDGRQVGAYGQLGTFSEYTLVQQIRVMRYERDIPPQVAAVTSCGVITGYGSAVRAAGIRDGDTVVVVGTGGVGMSAVMGAAIAGAAQIVAVDPVAFKREQALKLGATHAAPSVDAAQDLVSDLTRNRMADSAIITVGVLHGDLIGPVSRLVGKGGNVVMTSVSPVTENIATLPLVEFAMSAKNLVGVVMGLTRPLTDIDRIYALYRAGRLPLDNLVTRTYKLDDINTGYEDMHRGVNLRGVIAF